MPVVSPRQNEEVVQGFSFVACPEIMNKADLLNTGVCMQMGDVLVFGD